MSSVPGSCGPVSPRVYADICLLVVVPCCRYGFRGLLICPCTPQLLVSAMLVDLMSALCIGLFPSWCCLSCQHGIRRLLSCDSTWLSGSMLDWSCLSGSPFELGIRTVCYVGWMTCIKVILISCSMVSFERLTFERDLCV